MFIAPCGSVYAAVRERVGIGFTLCPIHHFGLCDALDRATLGRCPSGCDRFGTLSRLGNRLFGLRRIELHLSLRERCDAPLNFGAYQPGKC